VRPAVARAELFNRSGGAPALDRPRQARRDRDRRRDRPRPRRADRPAQAAVQTRAGRRGGPGAGALARILVARAAVLMHIGVPCFFWAIVLCLTYLWDAGTMNPLKEEVRVVQRSIGQTLVIVVAVLMLFISTDSFAQDELELQALANSVKETLKTVDYLPEILSMRVESRTNLDMLHLDFHQKYNPVGGILDLSDAEKRFFQVFVSDIEYPFTFHTTASNVLNFYRDNGRIPQNGLELLEYKSGSNTFCPKVSRLVAIGPDRDVKTYFKIFPTVFNMVNPATGRYISSFEQRSWSPLGVYFSELDEIPDAYFITDCCGEKYLPQGFSALRLVIYGEKENEVIYDYIISKYTSTDKPH